MISVVDLKLSKASSKYYLLGVIEISLHPMCVSSGPATRLKLNDRLPFCHMVNDLHLTVLKNKKHYHKKHTLITAAVSYRNRKL